MKTPMMMTTQRAFSLMRGRRGDYDVEKGGEEEEEEEEEEATKTKTMFQMTKRQLAMASLAVTMQTTTGMLREEGKEAKAMWKSCPTFGNKSICRWTRE